MEISNLITHIEALIFASEKPLTTLEITDLINNAFGFMEDKVVLDQVEAAIEGIIEKYNAEFYPFEVRESGGGWQFLTKKDFHKTVAQLNGDKFMKRLSTAAMETLAIISYKQPVTKAEIEAIRGVSSDYAIQKLLEKDLVVITGRNENLPGHPLVYATSKNFMDYFGINSPEDLPQLKDVYDETIVDATRVNEEALAIEAGEEAPETATAVAEPDAEEGAVEIENESVDKETADQEETSDTDAGMTEADMDTVDAAFDEEEGGDDDDEEEESDDETLEDEILEIEVELEDDEDGEDDEEDNEEDDTSDEDDDSSNGFSVGENGELIEDEHEAEDEVDEDEEVEDEEEEDDDEVEEDDEADEDESGEEEDPEEEDEDKKDKDEPGGEPG